MERQLKHPQFEVPLVLRRAKLGDAFGITQVYQEVYEGTYPDPLVTHLPTLKAALSSEEYYFMIGEHEGTVVGCVVYRHDDDNRLAKVFAGVVLPQYRGSDLTAELMKLGYDQMRSSQHPVEVVYATTRTVTAAPQKLTASLGYKKIGIFPNVHKTRNYETHGLTAMFSPEALSKRFTDFALHPALQPLYKIVSRECELSDLPIIDQPVVIDEPTSHSQVKLLMEPIEAPGFVSHRFRERKPTVQEHHWFFPFHDPNLLLTNPDQTIEIFAYLSQNDKHCALMGIRDVEGIGYHAILNQACDRLRAYGARYIEFIIRADEAEKIQTALDCQFIPCGYFPAMQLHDGKRFDYVTFSRSFEIFDFKKLALEGVNREFLTQYFDLWKAVSLDSLMVR